MLTSFFMNTRQIGILQILLSGVCFGFLGLFGKVAFKYGMTPGELLSLRYSLAGIMMACVYLVWKPVLFKLKFKHFIYSVLLGVFGYAVFSSFYFMALKGVSASLTVLLLYTYPLFVSMFSFVFFQERPSFIALALSSIGLVGLVWGEWAAESILFIAYGLASAFFYSLYVLISGQVLKGTNPLSTSLYMQLGTGLSLALISFQDISRPYLLITNHFWFLMIMAFVCSVLAMTLFLFGLQKLKSSEASLLSMSEPVSGVFIAMIFLGEVIKPIQILGGLAVCTGLYLAAQNKSSSS